MQFSHSDAIFIYFAIGTVGTVQRSTKKGQKTKTSDILYLGKWKDFLEDFFETKSKDI